MERGIGAERRVRGPEGSLMGSQPGPQPSSEGKGLWEHGPGQQVFDGDNYSQGGILGGSQG